MRPDGRQSTAQSSDNSSLPPSVPQVGNRKAPEQHGGKAQKRKPGGQRGHTANTLTHCNPDFIVPVRPQNLPPGDYTFRTVRSCQVVRIKFIREDTPYDYQMAVDRTIGKICEASPVDPRYSRKVQYDNFVKALLPCRSVIQGILCRRSIGILEALSDIKLRERTLDNVIKNAAAKRSELKAVEIIQANLPAQSVLHVDETCVTHNKQQTYAHVMTGGAGAFCTSARTGAGSSQRDGTSPSVWRCSGP